MEQRVDAHFHPNSYGYRPLKSSRQAIEQVRQNCLKQDWAIDMDFSKFFDVLDHTLLLAAVDAMKLEDWVKMYVRGRQNHKQVQFGLLGFSYQPRQTYLKGNRFMSFSCLPT